MRGLMWMIMIAKSKKRRNEKNKKKDVDAEKIVRRAGRVDKKRVTVDADERLTTMCI